MFSKTKSAKTPNPILGFETNTFVTIPTKLSFCKIGLPG